MHSMTQKLHHALTWACQISFVQFITPFPCPSFIVINTVPKTISKQPSTKDGHTPMSCHRRQASRVLPPELTLEGDEQPPKSTDSAKAIASPYGRHGSNDSSTDRPANPSTTIHPHRQDSSGNHSQGPEKKPSASTKPS